MLKCKKCPRELGEYDDEGLIIAGIRYLHVLLICPACGRQNRWSITVEREKQQEPRTESLQTAKYSVI
jgi:RNase P subunit RPR2